MTGVDINRAAELLYQAHQARVPINPLTERLVGDERARRVHDPRNSRASGTNRSFAWKMAPCPASG